MSASKAGSIWCAATLLCAVAAATNDIVAENLLPGSASDHWDVNGAGCPAVRGYITVSSALPGETVDLKMKIDAGERLRRVDAFRLGYYADGSSPAVRGIDVVLDTFFLVDLVANFRTGFYDADMDLVMEPRACAANYLRTWFTLDFVSSMPPVLELVLRARRRCRQN